MISRSELTDDEIMFLNRHKITISSLFDARGRPATSWGQEAKSLGLDFGLSSPCQHGHRLRDRKGHCIQCNTSYISFMRRNSAPAIVYIAASKKGKIYKVGSTVDHTSRQKALIREAYAGFDDWKIIAICKVQNSGAIEFEIHKKLENYKFESEYIVNSKVFASKEVFSCDLQTVWQAYQTCVKWSALPESKKSRVSNFSAFQF